MDTGLWAGENGMHCVPSRLRILSCSAASQSTYYTWLERGQHWGSSGDDKYNNKDPLCAIFLKTCSLWAQKEQRLANQFGWKHHRRFSSPVQQFPHILHGIGAIRTPDLSNDVVPVTVATDPPGTNCLCILCLKKFPFNFLDINCALNVKASWNEDVLKQIHHISGLKWEHFRLHLGLLVVPLY